MNREQMYKVIEEFLEERCFGSMRTKGEDYESRGDAFASLKANAERNFVTPERVQMILLTKHMDAITTWIERGVLSSEGIDERIADAVNMLLILYAYLHDEEKLPPVCKLCGDTGTIIVEDDIGNDCSCLCPDCCERMTDVEPSEKVKFKVTEHAPGKFACEREPSVHVNTRDATEEMTPETEKALGAMVTAAAEVGGDASGKFAATDLTAENSDMCIACAGGGIQKIEGKLSTEKYPDCKCCGGTGRIRKQEENADGGDTTQTNDTR